MAYWARSNFRDEISSEYKGGNLKHKISKAVSNSCFFFELLDVIFAKKRIHF